MKKSLLLLAVIGAGLLHPATAQSVNNVTEIITDFGGFWRSSTTTINAVKPNNSHDLLAFTLSGKRYSTGVDDALLTTSNVTFIPGKYKALPVSAIGGTYTSNTKVALGAAYDGVPNGASTPPPANDIPRYLRDGRNGLNLGTGAANVPAGTLDFTISQVVKEAADDGIPDILVTQIADPANSQDQYLFLDANDQQIGNKVTVTFTDIEPTGNWLGDFYEASQDPIVLASSFTNSPREYRLWAADLNAFGITQANAGSIRKFRVLLSGSSDLAFVAYNTQTATFFNPLPVQLTSFSGQAKAGYSDLSWHTAQEVNSASFEVQYSPDGRDFATVAQLAAAGTSSSGHSYSYRHLSSASGLRYYRLLQIDLDGSSTYSSVLALTAASTAGNVRVTAGPNPFGSSLTIYLDSPGPAPASATVQLHTLAGRPVYQHEFSGGLYRSAALELPDLPNLPAGIYLARVVVDGQSTMLKVVKQ